MMRLEAEDQTDHDAPLVHVPFDRCRFFFHLCLYFSALLFFFFLILCLSLIFKFTSFSLS